MAVVASAGQLVAIGRGEQAFMPRGVELSDYLTQSYQAIWRAQPQVRMVTHFLGRNIAQLGVHVFRRVSDTQRDRLTDHPLARTLAKPSPKTTRYRLIEALVMDMAVFDNAYWLKMARTDGGVGVIRLPPRRVTPGGDNWLEAESYEVAGARGRKLVYPADRVVHFHGYHPDDSKMGVSPLETLRRTLAEEYEAADYRSSLWKNAARISGYLRRPSSAPEWSPAAKQRFLDGWRELYTGSGAGAGGTPILEDDMEFTQAAFSAEQAQYIESRKLTREEVAAAYHIPPPLVGILEHATFANISEQHKHLYQDTLGPWLQAIVEELELQLLPDYADTRNVYVEFNLAEKLRGSFEEQAAVLQTSVGAPWLTRNEARARANLEPVAGGDTLVVPLNVLEGGQASPTDSAPKALPQRATKSAKAATGSGAGRWRTKYEQVVAGFFERQAKAVESRLGGKARAKAALDPTFRVKATLDDIFDDRPRWEAELAADLYAVGASAATAAARKVLEQIGADPDDFDDTTILEWLSKNAAGVSAGVNGVTAVELTAALADDEPVSAVRHVFELAKTVRTPQIAQTQSTTITAWGGREGAKRGGLNRKTWVTQSSKPRPSHAAMSGQTVGIEEKFSNGARWPGDSKLAPDEKAGCTCGLEFSREED